MGANCQVFFWSEMESMKFLNIKYDASGRNFVHASYQAN